MWLSLFACFSLSITATPLPLREDDYSFLPSFMYRSFASSQRKPEFETENEYWEQVKENKVLIPVQLNQEREVNTPPESGKFLKVVCIADLHSQLNDSHIIPEGDVLVVAGDLTVAGRLEELESFNQQMARLPHKHKLVIAGNHDLGFDSNENMEWRTPKLKGLGEKDGWRHLKGVQYLMDQEVTINGIKFYGSPWHPHPGFPFFADRKGGLAEKWRKIPSDTDVLITHVPPVGYLDVYAENYHWGCRDLLREIEERVRPRFHVFGHVHYCNGAMTNNVTTFINAAQLRKGKIYENSPIVFFIEKKSWSVD